jgi:hypothetical protein
MADGVAFSKEVIPAQLRYYLKCGLVSCRLWYAFLASQDFVVFEDETNVVVKKETNYIRLIQMEIKLYC